MKKITCILAIICISIISAYSQAADPIDYPIIYVRYPAEGHNSPFVTIPQGEKPYPIQMGGSLVLWSPVAPEKILVDCGPCSVMDPMMSFDGETVFYSLNIHEDKKVYSWLYKIHLTGDNAFTPIRLTFNDDFDSKYYAANKDKQYYQSHYFGIRDMAPVPLADGRVLFTSNRAGLTAFESLGHNPHEIGSVQQLYVMDDHEGDRVNKELANIKRLEAGTLHLAQHPFQLVDGRILFTTWQDVADKYVYGMSSLFTVHPDGSNLQQFTEPHDRNKFLDHFATQLTNQSVVSAYYYPSFDYGFGVLWRAPVEVDGPTYRRGFQKPNKNAKGYTSNRRYFGRKGTEIITTHSTPADVPAPGLSGKYSMPSATRNNGLLVAYSSGSVNYFGAACKKRNVCESLKSGVYLINDADKTVITSPSQLVKIIDSPKYNEIWPRAVLPYSAIHGVSHPKIEVEKAKEDYRLLKGEPSAIVGTSSMYNREPLGRGGDPFQASSNKRELNDGNWTISGAEAGVFNNSDIYAVRIIGTPPKPFTKPISKFENNDRWKSASRLIGKYDYDHIVERFGSYHLESWEILGEFPLNYKSVTDDQNNPDSSWAAKIPSETPFLIQSLDKNGMTLNSELTWRALKSGEVRTDCGGCHAHSIEPLDYETTFSGIRAPIHNIAGTDANSPGLNLGLWDLTTGKIPILSGDGVKYINKRVLGVEFNRDVKPIIEKNCITCHTNKGSAGMLVLDGSNGRSAWDNLSYKRRPDGKKYITPQQSKYIRVPQARQSLLAWVTYGERLDGRTNDTRKDDIDYPTHHPKLSLTDDEKRTIARWIDLGGPIDFPETDGMGYTDDNQLPILEVTITKIEGEYNQIIVGATDVHSNIDWSSLVITVEKVSLENTKSSAWFDSLIEGFKDNTLVLEPMSIDYIRGRVTYYLPYRVTENAKAVLVKARVSDLAGNKNESSQYLVLSNNQTSN
jgi:hypothetical protein